MQKQTSKLEPAISWIKAGIFLSINFLIIQNQSNKSIKKIKLILKNRRH